MWLSKPIYEGLPYYYMAVGVVALLSAFYARYWYLPEICSVGGVISLVGGLVIWLKRRDYRASRSRVDFEKTK